VDGVGNVNVSCDVPTSFTVSLGTGNGTIADRRMTGGPSQLAYNLYKDVSRLLVWGDGGGGVASNGTSVDLTVYGRIPGAQNVRPNVYADSVTVTVAF
jgi:spore coat protein U-like protein